MMRFDIETRAGKPIRAGRTRLIPFAQTVHLHLPGPSGGLVWSSPTAVLVQTPDGQETVLQIWDVTRQAQLTLLGLGLIGALFIWLFNRSGTALLPKRQAQPCGFLSAISVRNENAQKQRRSYPVNPRRAKNYLGDPNDRKQ